MFAANIAAVNLFSRCSGFCSWGQHWHWAEGQFLLVEQLVTVPGGALSELRNRALGVHYFNFVNIETVQRNVKILTRLCVSVFCSKIKTESSFYNPQEIYLTSLLRILSNTIFADADIFYWNYFLLFYFVCISYQPEIEWMKINLFKRCFEGWYI